MTADTLQAASPVQAVDPHLTAHSLPAADPLQAADLHLAADARTTADAQKIADLHLVTDSDTAETSTTGVEQVSNTVVAKFGVLVGGKVESLEETVPTIVEETQALNEVWQAKMREKWNGKKIADFMPSKQCVSQRLANTKSEWRHDDANEYACFTCTNKRIPCAKGEEQGADFDFVVLPLPAEMRGDKVSPTAKEFYIRPALSSKAPGRMYGKKSAESKTET